MSIENERRYFKVLAGNVKCPYDRRTREGKAWMRGTFKAVLEAQDSEE